MYRGKMIHTHCAGCLHTMYTSALSGQEVERSQSVRINPSGSSGRRYTIRCYGCWIRQRGKVFWREVEKLSCKRGIKQEFTPTDSLKYKGVAERALALINDAALAARIRAPVLYPGVPAYPSMWTEAVS